MSKLPTIESQKVQELVGSVSTFRPALLSWYQQNKRDLPWRLDWQRYRDPYRVWLSEIMLQQTVIKAVLSRYQSFLETFPSVHDLAKATEDEVRLAARGLGYYRRFRSLHQAAQLLSQQSGGSGPIDWPENFKDWKALPGVGDYTAAAVSSIAFGQAVPVVDGNVERLFCRLLDIREAPNLAPLKKLFFKIGEQLIGEDHPGDFNQALMEMGQTTCTKQNPNCHECPLVKLCLAYKNDSQTEAPQIKAKIEYQDLQMRVLIPANNRNQLAILERDSQAKFLKGSWGFPTQILKNRNWQWDGVDTDAVQEHFSEDLETTGLQKIGSFKHSITKHRITVDVFTAKLSKRDELPQARWHQPAELEGQLVANLDRKAWQVFSKWQHQH